MRISSGGVPGRGWGGNAATQKAEGEPTCFDNAAPASNVEPRRDEGDISQIENLGAVG